MSFSREAVLAELGIPQWRVRPGVSFPGAPMLAVHATPSVEEAEPVRLAEPVVPLPVAAEVAEPAHPAVDLCLYADAHDPAELELLERMADAVRGLREGLRVVTAGLRDQPIHGAVTVRLDGEGLPSLAAMAADPDLKRPVWRALKDAVARLP